MSETQLIKRRYSRVIGDSGDAWRIQLFTVSWAPLNLKGVRKVYLVLRRFASPEVFKTLEMEIENETNGIIVRNIKKLDFDTTAFVNEIEPYEYQLFAVLEKSGGAQESLQAGYVIFRAGFV